MLHVSCLFFKKKKKKKRRKRDARDDQDRAHLHHERCHLIHHHQTFPSKPQEIKGKTAIEGEELLSFFLLARHDHHLDVVSNTFPSLISFFWWFSLWFMMFHVSLFLNTFFLRSQYLKDYPYTRSWCSQASLSSCLWTFFFFFFSNSLFM